MKFFTYITLIALIACSNPLLAKKARPRKQVAIAAAQPKQEVQKQEETAREKKAIATLTKIRKEQQKVGMGIKIFGSDENPIPLALEKGVGGHWFPTTEALTNLLNTYKPLKEYMPGMPQVIVEKSTAEGFRTNAAFFAYRNASPKAHGTFVKGKPLFFLKISWFGWNIPERLDALQKGPVGRFGLKAMSNRELPIIVLQEIFFKYQDKDKMDYTIEVMHLAHGEEVYSGIIKANLTNLTLTQQIGAVLGLFHRDLTLIQDCGEKVGKALGLFQVEFMQYKHSISPNDWRTMIHGDFHTGNVFFDKKTSRVYFIDNSGMREGGTLFKDLGFLEINLSEALSSWDKDKRNAIASFLLSFIKGYLNAYPLDKRKYMVEYLREDLGRRFNRLYASTSTQSGARYFMDNFIKKLNEIFDKAYPQ
jgi:hypothetical protein